jgi:hypothetical protein
MGPVPPASVINMLNKRRLAGALFGPGGLSMAESPEECAMPASVPWGGYNINYFCKLEKKKRKTKRVERKNERKRR